MKDSTQLNFEEFKSDSIENSDSVSNIFSQPTETLSIDVQSHLNLIISMLDASREEVFLGLISYDTVFTVLVTLLVFFVGIVIDRLIKYCDHKYQQNQLRQYFKHFLNITIDKTCPQLIKMYEDVYKNNSIDDGIPSVPPKLLTGNFERIKSIQNPDWFHSFDDKRALSQIVSNTDFLDLMIKEIDDFHRRIKNESEEYAKPLTIKVNQYFDTLAKYLESFQNTDQTSVDQKKFYEFVNDCVVYYHEEPGIKRRFSSVYREIIRPIQEMVIGTNLNRDNTIGREIAVLGKEISIEYQYLRRTTVNFRIAYRNYSRLIKDTESKLAEARAVINWNINTCVCWRALIPRKWHFRSSLNKAY